MAISRRRLLAFSGGAAIAALLPAAADADESAAAFLASIYDRYRTDGDWIDYSDAAVIRRLFAPPLAALILADQEKAAAAGEVPALDGDPFIDAQDGEITDLSLSVDETGANTAIGYVSFRNTGLPKRIELRLLKGDAGWQIDDIVWPEGTLRGLYPL